MYLIATCGLPLLALVGAAITRAVGVPSTPANWTLDNFRAVLTPRTGQALGRSLLLSLSAASILLILGLITAALGRTRLVGDQRVDHLTSYFQVRRWRSVCCSDTAGGSPTPWRSSSSHIWQALGSGASTHLRWGDRLPPAGVRAARAAGDVTTGWAPSLCR
jgi:hypothetical protein